MHKKRAKKKIETDKTLDVRLFSLQFYIVLCDSPFLGISNDLYMKLFKLNHVVETGRKQGWYHLGPNLADREVALGPRPDDRAYAPGLKFFSGRVSGPYYTTVGVL